MRLQAREVDAARVPDGPTDVAHAADPNAISPEEARGHGPDVAKTLDGNAPAAQLEAQASGRLVEHIDQATTGGLSPARRPAHDERLAGHHARDTLALGHGVSVHDPGHRLLVGAEIRRRNVEIRTDEEDDLGRVAPRQGLSLPEGQRPGVTADAPLGPAVGQAHERALPAHQHGQGRHLAQTDVEVVAEAPLRWPEGCVVVYPIAHEHLGPAGVHPDWDGDDEGPAGMAKPLVNLVVQGDPLGHAVELGHGRPVQTRLELGVWDHRDPFLLTPLFKGAKLRLKRSATISIAGVRRWAKMRVPGSKWA